MPTGELTHPTKRTTRIGGLNPPAHCSNYNIEWWHTRVHTRSGLTLHAPDSHKYRRVPQKLDNSLSSIAEHKRHKVCSDALEATRTALSGQPKL